MPQAVCAGGVSDTDAIAALTLQAGAEIAARQPVQAVGIVPIDFNLNDR